MIKFAQIKDLPSNSTVSIPVLINTSAKEINAIQAKINVEGEIADLNLTTKSDLPLQAVSNLTMNNQALISLTHEQVGESWQNSEDEELFFINFSTKDEGDIVLSFDTTQTMIGYVQDGQKTTIGEKLILKVVDSTADEAMEQTTTTAETQELAVKPDYDQNNSQPTTNIYLPTAIAVISITFALTIIFLRLKKKPAQEQPTKSNDNL